MLTRLTIPAAGKELMTAFLAVFFSTFSARADNSLTSLELGLNELVYRLSRSVVTVETSQPSMPMGLSKGGGETVYNLITTGLIYDREGHIVTMAESVLGRSQVFVRYEEQLVPAAVEAIDYQTGLALLKVDRSLGNPVELVDQPGCAGQMVLALGNAFGVRATPSLGFCAGARSDGNLQFTANFTSGTLGGGLFTLDGQLVGVITGTISEYENNYLGLALPSHRIIESVSYLMNHGNRPVGYLGTTTAEIEIVPPIEIGAFNRLASFSDDDLIVDRGLLVTKTLPRSPAAMAGLMEGDLIFQVDGRRMASAVELSCLVKRSMPGSSIQFDIIRGNNVYKLSVKVGQGKLLPETSLSHDFSKQTPSGVQPSLDSLTEEIRVLRKVLYDLEQRVYRLRP